jgi:hypothetical protein
MREPESERERLLAGRIDYAGQVILDGGAPWKDGILKFSHPYDSLTEREQAFIDERLTEWKLKVLERTKPRGS